jgi:hypothetical protein
MERLLLHGLFQGTIHIFTGETEEENKTLKMSYWDSNWTPHKYKLTVCLVHQPILFQIVWKQNVSWGLYTSGMLCGVGW